MWLRLLSCWRIMASEVRREDWSFEREDITLKGNVWHPKEWYGSVVLFLHGFMANRFAFAKYARHLAGEGYLCIAYDARAHGKTGGQVDIPAMVDDVGAIVDSLYFEHDAKAVGLMGHSMGGWVSTMAAADCTGINAVVSLAGASNPVEDVTRTGKPIHHLLKIGYSLYDLLEEKDKDIEIPVKSMALIGAIKETLMGEDVDPKHLRLNDASFVNIFAGFQDPPNALEYAPRVEVPFLSFHGTDDVLVPIEAGYELYEAVSSEDKDWVSFDGEGHTIPFTKYEEISQKTLDFFEKWL